MGGNERLNPIAPVDVWHDLEEQLELLHSDTPLKEIWTHFTPNFVDTQVAKFDMEEALRAMSERCRIYQETKITQPSAVITLDTELPVSIFFSGDWHFGSIYTDHERLLEDLHKIMETPNAYLFLMANLIDNGIPAKYPDAMLRNSLPPQEQVIAVRKIIQKLDEKGKILGAVVSPCHEGWCIDAEKSEILTRNGWKKEEEILIGSEIVTFNIFTEKFEYARVLDKYSGYYNGEMFHFKNDNVDLLCTPNHKILYINSSKKYFHEAKLIKNISNIKFWQTTKFANQQDGSNRGAYDYSLMLVAWIITEGTYSKKFNRITIYQSTKNLPMLERIRKILRKNHIKFKESIHPSGFGGADVVGFSFKPSVDFMKRWFPTEAIHRIPRRIFDFRKKKRILFLRELMLGDGTSREFTYNTRSWELASDVQELAIKSGIKATIGKKGEKDWAIYMKEPNGRNGGNFVWIGNGEMRKIDFKGKIWCPHTKNGTIVVRRNGKVCITGNTWTVAGQDINAMLFGYEGRKFPVLENGGITHLFVGSQEYQIASYHQIGPFESNFNPTHGIRQMNRLRARNVDIICAAHKHWGATLQVYEGVAESMRPNVYIRSGTYKLDDQWARERWGILGEPSGQSVMLWPNERRMQEFLDIDTAIEAHEAIYLVRWLETVEMLGKIRELAEAS